MQACYILMLLKEEMIKYHDIPIHW